jgi:hypothetical protein
MFQMLALFLPGGKLCVQVNKQKLMEKSIAVTCECSNSDSITSMTEAFFGLKLGTLSSNINSRKFTIEDQEYKWGDERHREGNEGSDDESSEEANVTEY